MCGDHAAGLSAQAGPVRAVTRRTWVLSGPRQRFAPEMRVRDRSADATGDRYSPGPVVPASTAWSCAT
ncbi:hypothetical protein DVA67_030880 [Solirubrobacter sp. CPCC 204708]|nr:hypothetical protein [Solirubrobacter deserti]